MTCFPKRTTEPLRYSPTPPPFLKTSCFGRSAGLDEGLLVAALEPLLLKLVAGSYAVVVTRCLQRLLLGAAVSAAATNHLSVLMSTTRTLRRGEEVSAWVVKVVANSR